MNVYTALFDGILPEAIFGIYGYLPPII